MRIFLVILFLTQNSFACYYDLECAPKQVCEKKPLHWFGVCKKVSKK